MNKLCAPILGVFIFLIPLHLVAQADSIPTYAEFMPIPMMRSCEYAADSTWNADSIRNCALAALNKLIAQELRYPDEALRDSIQGRVVLSFVLDTLGQMNNFAIVKDPGGGLGAEALRIFQRMHEAGLRWVPAKNAGKRTPIKLMWPIKFQIKSYEPPKSFINEQGLEIFTEPDSFASFRGGEDALLEFLTDEVHYPETERSNCKCGVIEANLLILPGGLVEIVDLIDFSSLGFEFQWEATKLLNKSAGRWLAAQYQGKEVASSVPVRILFKSDHAACKSKNEQFDQSVLKYAEGLVAYEEKQYANAIAAFTQALTLAPGNTEYLYYRGAAHLANNDNTSACTDYHTIKSLLGSVWFKQIYRLLCGGF